MPERRLGLIARSRRAVLVAGLGLSVVLAACSGPGSSKPTPTATAPATVTVTSTAPSTATEAPSPTATATTPPTETPAPTATATIQPTAAATVAAPTPTATEVPLPSGGAEVKVITKPITRIVQGNTDGSVLYAETSAGISRSTDGGSTWVAAGDNPNGRVVAALNDPDVLYAGEHAGCARGAEVGETPLTRSTDGGQTWETFKNGAGIEPLLVQAGQSSVVVGTNCSLQVSTDGGQSWIAPNVTQNYDIYAAASSKPDALDGPIILLGISEGGTSGAWIIDLTTSSVVTRSDIVKFYGHGAVAWLGNRIVLATTEGVAVSNDNGQTWTWSRKGLESVTYSVDPLKEPIPAGEQGRTLGFSIARIHPDDANHIWIAGQMGAFTSSDGGQTWAPLGDRSSIDTLAISTGSNRVYVSANGGTRSWTLDEH